MYNVYACYMRMARVYKCHLRMCANAPFDNLLRITVDSSRSGRRLRSREEEKRNVRKRERKRDREFISRLETKFS